MRRALGVAVALALGTACSGGLAVNDGLAYPCQFDRGPETRDQACSPGWVCGVTNLCQEDKPEGLPAELVPPTFDGRGLIQPLVPEAAGGVGTSPRSFAALVSLPDAGDWVYKYAGTLPFSLQNFHVAGVSDRSDGTGFIAMDADGGIAVLQPDGGTGFYPTLLPVVGFRSAWGRLSVPEEAPVDAIAYSASAGQRVYPLDPDGVPGKALSADGGMVLDVRRINGARIGLPQLGAGSGPSLAPVYVVALPEGDGGVALSTPRSWFPLTDAVDLELPVRLQHSPGGDLWLLDFNKKNNPRRWIAGFTLGIATQYQFTQLMETCVPCPDGSVPVALTPLSAQPFSAQVLCEDLFPKDAYDVAPQAFQITGEIADPVTDACTETALTPPFPPDGVTAVDDSVGGFITLGGPLAAIWAGPSLSRTLPVLLDAAPNGTGTVDLVNDDSGAITRAALAFTDRYFAVDFLDLSRYGVLNAGYTVIGSPAELPAGTPPPSIEPAASVTGADGWLISSEGLLLHVELHEHGVGTRDSGVDTQTLYGAQLLDPTGAPAGGPFLGETTRDGTSFVLAADDSLYLDAADQLAKYPGQVPPSTPQLTPQAGFPIRSLTIDRSEGQSARVHGYAVTSNTLYEFELGGTPEHWSGHQIVLSGDEPVKVWMQDAHSAYGRVGYRDGTMYTLPDGLPLATALRRPDGGADRVLDYANFGGWPLALAPSGLYLARREGGQDHDGGTQLLTWRRVTLPDGGEPWAKVGRKMAVLPERDAGEVLRVFAEDGLVFEVGHTAR